MELLASMSQRSPSDPSHATHANSPDPWINTYLCVSNVLLLHRLYMPILYKVPLRDVAGFPLQRRNIEGACCRLCLALGTQVLLLILKSWQLRRRPHRVPSRRKRTRRANTKKKHKERPGQGRLTRQAAIFYPACSQAQVCAWCMPQESHWGGGGTTVCRAWERGPRERHNHHHNQHNRPP